MLSATFSSDGRRIVTTSEDDTARIWDAATGVTLAVLRGGHTASRSAVFDRAGQRVITSSRDDIARIWDGTEPSDHAVALSGPGKGKYDRVVQSDDL